MKKNIALLLLTVAFCILAIFSSLNAETVPMASVVKEVVDYFYNGQEEGPILVESKLCKTIKSLNCEEVMDSSVISMGEPIKVWTQFFVPKGAIYDDIFVEYKHEGVPRHLKARKVEGSIRFRIVDTYKPDKIGKWTITIKKGLTDLKTFDIEVIKK
jgi:hypothetical protein